MQIPLFIVQTVLLTCLVFSLNAQHFSIETVPNPKENRNDFVSNPDQIITSAEETKLNKLLYYLERETSIEVAVVLVNSIGDQKPADFATTLINYWGVGKRGLNNGLLVLMVKGQRRIEFRTGYGLETILTDIECKDIQQKHMVPAFKAEKYGVGILQGLSITIGTLLKKSIQDPKRLKKALNMINNQAYFDSEFEVLNQKIAQEYSSLELILDSITNEATPITNEKLWVLGSKTSNNRASEEIYKPLKNKIPQMTENPFLNISLIILDDFKMLSAYDVKFKFLESIDGSTYDQTNEHLLLLHLPQSKTTSFIRYGKSTITTEVIQQLIVNSKAIPQDNFQQLDTLVSNIEKAYTDNAYLQRIQDQVKQNKLRSIKHYAPVSSPQNSAWVSAGWIYFYSTIGFSSLSLLFILLSFGLKDPYKKHGILQFSGFKFWMFIFPIPHIGIWYIISKLQHKYRNAPRNSKKNGKPMHKLSEREEDRFLKEGQITEEKINSVHYDVWTTNDHDDILILPYKTWFSRYSSCSSCGYKTYYQVYNRTIRAATYSSSGLGEKKHACKNCNYSQVRTYIIPRKERSSSSSSSSSSGGSWGGGSSGGGGAGSSW
ncbi:MAG: TPM domain-containing protein [Saprospiraceae bacterium]|nr:TPM domain-containing protein [Saprospiraceae bacterium]